MVGVPVLELLRQWPYGVAAPPPMAQSCVASFVCYIYAKYYLNWFAFDIVIMKIIGVNFFEKKVYRLLLCPRQK